MPRPTTFIFAGLTSGEVYNRTQTHEEIHPGDVLVVPPNPHEEHSGIVGFLYDAWPVVVKDGKGTNGWLNDHSFHTVIDVQDLLAGTNYRESFDAAMAISPFAMPHCARCYRATEWPVERCGKCPDYLKSS